VSSFWGLRSSFAPFEEQKFIADEIFSYLNFEPYFIVYKFLLLMLHKLDTSMTPFPQAFVEDGLGCCQTSGLDSRPISFAPIQRLSSQSFDIYIVLDD